jgi:hypothetical protein
MPRQLLSFILIKIRLHNGLFFIFSILRFIRAHFLRFGRLNLFHFLHGLVQYSENFYGWSPLASIQSRFPHSSKMLDTVPQSVFLYDIRYINLRSRFELIWTVSLPPSMIPDHNCQLRWSSFHQKYHFSSCRWGYDALNWWNPTWI